MSRLFEKKLTTHHPSTVTKPVAASWANSFQSIMPPNAITVGLILLRHKFRRALRGRLCAQCGHRSIVCAIATASRRRIVAIELGTWRSGLIGGAAGSVTTGKGRFFEPPGDTWS